MTENKTTKVSSETSVVEIHRALPTVVIGERINPTGRKKLQAEMETGRFELVKHDAKSQVEAGASILDVNAGVADGDEPSLLKGAIQAVIEQASRLGIPVEDVVIDPLLLTIATDGGAAQAALRATELIVREFGVNIAMGVSNVSFGLPDRSSVNASFMAMAIRAGLTCPIANPLDSKLATAILAADLALGKDDWGERWIAAYRSRSKPVRT